MKVFLNFNNRISFKQNISSFKDISFDEDFEYGYDNPNYKMIRNALREDIFERAVARAAADCQGAKFKREEVLPNTPKFFSDERLRSLAIDNFRELKKGCYRGESLVNKPHCLDLLKDIGLKRVIDLAEKSSLKLMCGQYGLIYDAFPIFENYWDHPAFLSVMDYAEQAVQNYAYKNNNAEIASNITNGTGLYSIKSREFINEFIKFIDEINKGDFYICCNYGVDRTGFAVLLNEHFNPKWGIQDYPAGTMDKKYMYEFYKKLTDDDKLKLGFNKEFDKNLKERLITKRTA